MAKLDDETLLSILQEKEDDAGHYVYGTLSTERDALKREYYRKPYGNEEDGWSQIVASDTQDTVEWILPALLKTFSSTDKAVSFEPSRQSDVAGADQATEACNYVFYKQNNGFLILYTAFKDALMVRNSATMWRKETQEVVETTPFKQATAEMLAMLLQEPDTEIQESMQEQAFDEMGNPVIVYTGRLKKIVKRTIVKVESFNPDDLLIAADWTSPLLEDCPYVARLMKVTHTELKMMGLKCTPEELRSSDGNAVRNTINQATGQEQEDNDQSEDDSMAEGWLRMEWVLIDADGDGIAERMCIYRLKDRILKKEEVSHVPIATWSPILNTHQWDGMAMSDIVSDLQKLHTELLRQTVNSAVLANNPRTKVLTDSNGSPYANIDDLLDSRAGGVLRQSRQDAITEQVTPFVAGATMPLLEYVQSMRENRTGVSRTSMGLNPDSLNNTATGRQIDQSAAMQRIELIARIAAECLVKPIFKGILKLLTDGGMEKMAFRLRDEFVEYDPNEWRDSYDMTINVGLGTGDKQQQGVTLMAIMQMQQQGLALGMVEPKHLYHSASKFIENAGFKDIQNFLQDPSKTPPKPTPPPVEVQVAQMKVQADGQKHQAEQQADIQKFQAETAMTREVEQIKADAKLQEIRANLELQAANDQRDAEREAMKAQLSAQAEAQRLEFERWKAELDARVKLRIAKIGQEQSGDDLMAELDDAEALDKPNPIDQLAQMHMQTLQMIGSLADAMNKPKAIVRDQNGRAIGVQPVQG
jgi:hypothetical protein